MGYKDFRDLVRGMGDGLDEIWRQSTKEGDIVILGKRQDAIIPLTVPGHQVLLPKGDDTIFEDEEVSAHCRAINRLLGRPDDWTG
jgi:hypothetical protein